MISYHIALAALQCDAVKVAAASVFDAALECTMCWGRAPAGLRYVVRSGSFRQM